MQRLLASLTIVLVLGMVITRVLLMRRRGFRAMHFGKIGLLPISWSSDNGSQLFVDSLDEGTGRSSPIGTYLTQVAENSAGVWYPRELCGRSVLYSSFHSAPNARACG